MFLATMRLKKFVNRTRISVQKVIVRFFFIGVPTWLLSKMILSASLKMREAELERVLKCYSRYGFVGCIGLIDCVHIGWDRCPTEWRPIFVGKEGYPSIVYKVICDNQHKIQAVSPGHPGPKSDKTIVKLDDAVAELKLKNTWLGSMPWIVLTEMRLKKLFG
jgi:hypothetical protein